MISEHLCVMCDRAENARKFPLPTPTRGRGVLAASNVTIGCDECYSRGRRLLAGVEIWKLLLQVGNLRRVVIDDVGIVGVKGGVILVVSFGGIEGLQWDDLSHYGTREDFGLVELRDIGLGDSLLLIVDIENG